MLAAAALSVTANDRLCPSVALASAIDSVRAGPAVVNDHVSPLVVPRLFFASIRQ